MKCKICKEPASGVVVYNKESNSNTGYIVVDNAVSFDTGSIAKFFYYCASRGVRLTKDHGVVDLCQDCIRAVRISQN